MYHCICPFTYNKSLYYSCINKVNQ
ncbi:fibronectin type II domain-containing protein [Dysgonomonas sp. HDW5B]